MMQKIREILHSQKFFNELTELWDELAKDIVNDILKESEANNGI